MTLNSDQYFNHIKTFNILTICMNERILKSKYLIDLSLPFVSWGKWNLWVNGLDPLSVMELDVQPCKNPNISIACISSATDISMSKFQ